MTLKTRTVTKLKLESPTVRMDLECAKGQELSNVIRHLVMLTQEFSELDIVVQAVNEQRERLAK